MSTSNKELANKIVAEVKAVQHAQATKVSAAAHAKALAAKEHARAEAALAKAKEDMFEVLRLNYFKVRNFNDYIAAYNSRVPNEDGFLPFVDPDDYERPAPTKEEWATLNDQQKLEAGSITTFNLNK